MADATTTDPKIRLAELVRFIIERIGPEWSWKPHDQAVLVEVEALLSSSQPSAPVDKGVWYDDWLEADLERQQLKAEVTALHAERDRLKAELVTMHRFRLEDAADHCEGQILEVDRRKWAEAEAARFRAERVTSGVKAGQLLGPAFDGASLEELAEEIVRLRQALSAEGASSG